jgi:hypothetical protein
MSQLSGLLRRTTACALVLSGIALQAFVACAAEEPADDAPKERPAKFDEVYRLADSEVVKFFPAPFIPERAEFLRWRRVVSAENLPHLGRWQVGFNWDGKKADYWSLSASKGSIASALSVAGLGRADYEGDPQTLHTELAGDWLVRKGAPRDEIIAAVARTIRQVLKRKIEIEKVRVKREVVVVTGQYKFHPAAGAADNRTLYLYTDELTEETGGGTYSLGELLKTVSGMIDKKIIDETKPMRKQIRVSIQLSADDVDSNADKRDQFLKNLEAQTSLEFKSEQREVDVWRVTEKDAPAIGL